MSCISGVGSLGGSRELCVDILAPRREIELVVDSFTAGPTPCLEGLDPLDPEAMVER